MKTFIRSISDQPITGIKRQIKFIQFPIFNLNDNIPVIRSEFGVLHSLNGMALPQLDKSIFITADGIGDYLPIDLDMDAQGNLIGTDSELIPDNDFAINWMFNNKGLVSLFDLMIKLKDVKQYNIDGKKYEDGDDVNLFIYSALDLKYYGVII